MPRTAIVTGASGAIGAATVRLLSEVGWDVLGVDAQAAPVEKDGATIVADVAEAAGIESVKAAVQKRFSKLDCIVHCAAVQIVKPLEETTDADWDLTMRTNVTSVFRLARELSPLLDGGAIVNVSSVHARATSAGMLAYVASKGALSALTRALALELAGRRIRVNAILPGAVESGMLRAGLERSPDSAAARRGLVAGTPLRRIGSPEEIAELVLFLADTERSGFITGQEFVADGGVLARLASE